MIRDLAERQAAYYRRLAEFARLGGALDRTQRRQQAAMAMLEGTQRRDAS